MDIGINEITNIIASSTTNYLVVFSPIFLLMGGLILAIVVTFALISIFTQKKIDIPVFDDDLADDLEEFYGRHGRGGSHYDYDDIKKTW